MPCRGPETGLVTFRGRIGGGGAPFNLGEATVTRATIRLGTGETGRPTPCAGATGKAELSAISDALAQRQARAVVETMVAGAERGDTEREKASRETGHAGWIFSPLVAERIDVLRPENYTGGYADPVFDAQSMFKRGDGRDGAAGTVAGRVAAKPRRRRCRRRPPQSRWRCVTTTRRSGSTRHDRGWAIAAPRFHTGCARVRDQGPVRICLATDSAPAALKSYRRIRAGTQEYPDRSTTVILQSEPRRRGGGGPPSWGGADVDPDRPGHRGTATLAPRGLPQNFEQHVRPKTGRPFPRGVDVMLVTRD